MNNYYVYILSNKIRSVLYVGVTNDLERRVEEHRQGVVDGFTKKYNTHDLVYYEETTDVAVALEREKQIKGLSRVKKEQLIKSINPKFENLLP